MSQNDGEPQNAPAVSIIVPVYKVEEYLDRCVQSIFAQSFTDYELILVDDGSPDRCGEMCDAYAERDSRVRVIHKENGGLSDARNAGIDIARGQYVSVIDSDDTVDKGMFSSLIEIAIHENADIVGCGIRDCRNGDTVSVLSSAEIEQCVPIVCSGEEALKIILEGKRARLSANCYLYSKVLFSKKRFMKGRLYEDAFFIPEAMLAVDKVAITPAPFYNYWHRDESITTEPFKKKHLDIIAAFERALELVRSRCPDLVPVAQFRVDWGHFVVLDRILICEDYSVIPEYDEMVRYLKRNWKRIATCQYFEKTRRFAAVVLKANVRLYRLLLIAQNRRLSA